MEYVHVHWAMSAIRLPEARFRLERTAGPDMPRLGAHARPGFTLRPAAVTWDFAVFEATGPARSAYACIPRDSLPGFAAALEQGALDDPIAAYLALTSRRRVLSGIRRARRPDAIRADVLTPRACPVDHGTGSRSQIRIDAR